MEREVEEYRCEQYARSAEIENLIWEKYYERVKEDAKEDAKEERLAGNGISDLQAEIDKQAKEISELRHQIASLRISSLRS